MSIKGFSMRSSQKSSKTVLETIMNEMKIKCKLKNELLDAVNKGKSIPFVPQLLIEPVALEKPDVRKTIKLPPKPLQRMKSTIVESGSYEVERYRPNPSQTRPAKEKERFQNLMAFGKEFDDEENDLDRIEEHAAVSIDPADLFNEILMEIKERIHFLKDMKDLGLEKKYLPEIQCQISLRLKELEKLDKVKAEEVFQKYGM